MSKKPYTQPMLVDRGKVSEQTLETQVEVTLEKDMITPTAGNSI